MNDNTENKRKLDAILKAFEEHIEGQNYFDVVYSKRSAISGLWLTIPAMQGPYCWTSRRRCLTNFSMTSSTMLSTSPAIVILALIPPPVCL